MIIKKTKKTSEYNLLDRLLAHKIEFPINMKERKKSNLFSSHSSKLDKS